MSGPKRIGDLLDEIAEMFGPAIEEEERRMRDRRETHPDNGKPGWWRVVGVRHRALVRAAAASEAMRKATEAGAVDESWELPDVDFLGAELPDVVRI